MNPSEAILSETILLEQERLHQVSLFFPQKYNVEKGLGGGEGESVETPGDPGLFHRYWTELKMSNKRDSVTIFSIFIFGLKYLSGPL